MVRLLFRFISYKTPRTLNFEPFVPLCLIWLEVTESFANGGGSAGFVFCPVSCGMLNVGCGFPFHRPKPLPTVHGSQSTVHVPQFTVLSRVKGLKVESRMSHSATHTYLPRSVLRPQSSVPLPHLRHSAPICGSPLRVNSRL